MVVFSTFFNFSLNLAISTSWSQPQSAPSLVFADYIELLHLSLQKYNQVDFGVNHLVMSMCRVFSCVVGRGCLLWPVHSLDPNFRKPKRMYNYGKQFVRKFIYLGKVDHYWRIYDSKMWRIMDPIPLWLCSWRSRTKEVESLPQGRTRDWTVSKTKDVITCPWWPGQRFRFCCFFFSLWLYHVTCPILVSQLSPQ